VGEPHPAEQPTEATAPVTAQQLPETLDPTPGNNERKDLSPVAVFSVACTALAACVAVSSFSRRERPAKEPIKEPKHFDKIDDGTPTVRQHLAAWRKGEHLERVPLEDPPTDK
jgi:hypothetical protein